jgi:hypothetical protein
MPKDRSKSITRKSRPLTARRERFCALIASGESQADAWIKAGYKVSREVARRNAAESLTIPAVAARVAELLQTKTKKLLLSRDAKREMLAKWAEDPNAKLSDRIRAIEIDAKLAGHFEPKQHVVETGPRTLASIEERARRISAVLSIVVPES